MGKATMDPLRARSAVGANASGQCSVPPLAEGDRYVSAAAGAGHTLLVLESGDAVAVGHKGAGRCEVPKKSGGDKYVKAAAGTAHSVLIKDNGEAVLFGKNDFGQAKAPELEPGWKSDIALHVTYGRSPG